MSTSFELVFTGKDLATAGDLNAEISIKHDSGQLVVPVCCCAPKGECVLDGSLDFGFVTCGGGTDPSRKVHVVNQGNRPGAWAISFGEGNNIPLQLKPERGTLEPGERQEVSATLHEISAGQHTGSLVLTTDGRKDPKLYSCSAQAVSAAFNVVGQGGQTMLEVRPTQNCMCHFSLVCGYMCEPACR
jgi:hypothetical protein